MFTTTTEATAAESERFGRDVARAELLATISEPGRPLGLLGAALALAVAVNTHLLGASWLMAATALVGTLLSWLTLVWLLTRRAEGRACQRSAASWRYQAVSGATAVGLRVLDHPTGGWLLQSMAAHPRGGGAGTQLMHRICAQADDSGAVIALVAVTARTANWYASFGFERSRRTFPIGQWRMERQPCADHAPRRVL